MEIEEKDLNVLVSYFKENPNLKLLNFINYHKFYLRKVKTQISIKFSTVNP